MNLMQSFNSKKTFFVVIVILLIILFALILMILKTNPRNTSNPSKYSAVYLKTGDIYFGELSWFPSLKLKNPWFLQSAVDADNNPQVSISKFSDAFWKPVGEIYLNKNEIVFWTRIRSDSQVIPLLSGQGNPN